MADDEELDELPVISHKAEILEHVRKYQVTICISETGSGKTTQIPQFIVDAVGDAAAATAATATTAVVAVTQPRRVAAITVAQRVASERRCRVGDEVGYVVRFDDCTSTRTRIKYMTDGILVRECLQDATLSRYAVVMLDEAHERSLSTDILLGLVKSACQRRPELRVVVTSATLDSDKMSRYFDGCPVLNIPGRVFPVDIYHSKMTQTMTAAGPSSSAYVEAAVDTVMKIHSNPNQDHGHILVFLTGSDEIERACRMIRARLADLPRDDYDGGVDMVVLPLYASLPTDAQQSVFRKPQAPGRRSNGDDGGFVRKCIVATNIAETSITVPNVRFVVDSGFVKQKTYDPARHLESLVVVPISQVAAAQRAGRAGRTAPGQCYRMYSSACLQAMMPETVPEIRRSHMGNAVLYLKALGIHDVLGFDFLDPPSEAQMLEALVLLHMLGALDAAGAVTALGRAMAALPLDPHASRMLLAAAETGCANAAAAVAGVLSSENIWHTPPRGNTELVRAAEAAHAALRSPLGDHVTYLHVMQRFDEAGGALQWCERHFLRHRALRTAATVRDQLLDELHKTNFSGVGAAAGGNAPPPPAPVAARGPGAAPGRELDLSVVRAVAAAYFCNAARKSANSDKIFHAVPLNAASSSSSSSSSSSAHDAADGLHLMQLHPSSALVSFTAADAAVAAGGRMEYAVYQELVQGGGRPCMKHASWVPTDVLRRARQQYQALAYPPALSGRAPPPPTTTGDADADGAAGSNSNSRKRDASALDSTAAATAQGDAAAAAAAQEKIASAKARFLARKGR
jgi:ATP-dependent RNA helicase DHX8/PRP22